MSDLPVPGTVADVEASRRGKRTAAFFDFDGTTIRGFSAQVLATDRLRRRDIGAGELLSLGRWGINAGLGRAGFTELLETNVRALRSRSHDELEAMSERLFESKIRDLIYPEALALIAAHQQRGHTVVLISSATNYQTRPAAAHLGIEHLVCNELAVADGILTGELTGSVVWGSSKADRANEFAAAHNIDMQRSFFYADGDEDEALMYDVGHPRPTNPRKGLTAAAEENGWPVTRFAAPDSSGAAGALKGLLAPNGKPASLIRTAIGLATVGPAAAEGLLAGVMQGDRRTGVDHFIERWLDTLFLSCGVTLDIQGRDHLWESRPAVFLFNHKNNFDILIAAKLVGSDFTSVGKKEAADNPLGAALGKLVDAVFIDRSDSVSAVEALQPVQDAVARGLSLIISPEGTRSKTGDVLPFKKGPFRIAMAAGVPVVPIVIRNAEDLGPRDANVMRSAHIDIKVLAPVPTDDWSIDDLADHIAAVRRQFVDTLDAWGDDAG